MYRFMTQNCDPYLDLTNFHFSYLFLQKTPNKTPTNRTTYVYAFSNPIFFTHLFDDLHLFPPHFLRVKN